MRLSGATINLFMKIYLFLQVHYQPMDEEKLAPVGDSKKTTLKDVGKGFIILGAFVLLLSVVFFLMSIRDNEYYGLFSGRTHLAFDLILGLTLLSVGLLLVRLKSAKNENPDGKP